MESRASTEYRYEKLTWPEINDAVELRKVCIVPCGSVEQHAPHLPLDTDIVCPTEIARGAGRRAPEKLLVLPPVAYGYTGHVMDFPGTINTDFEHFIHQVLDITKSLAYHGFKKLVLLNGHGSNMPNLDLVARRTNLETDAECVLIAWWNLLTVDKAFLPRWRQSPFNWVDLFGAGPGTLVSWTSTYTESGGVGAADLATAEKGRAAYEEAVAQLLRFVDYFRDRPVDQRRDRHRQPPTMPLPWGQRPVTP